MTTAVVTAAGKYGYGLDPVGNITKFTSPSGTSTATYNKVNEVTALGGKPFVYDADGNLVSDGARTYTWDAENRLVGVGQAGAHSSFAYDGLSRRVAIAATKSGKTTTTRYLWCGTQICEARTGVSAIARLYYREGEAIPAAKAADDTLFYYGPDQLGSVRDVYAKSPVFSMVQAYDYDPHGNPIKAPANGPFPDFRYAGMFYPVNGTVTGGLYMTQYRAYDSSIGRWLSRDPLGESIGANLYAYVKDDPINAIDPAGLQCDPCSNAFGFGSALSILGWVASSLGNGANPANLASLIAQLNGVGTADAAALGPQLFSVQQGILGAETFETVVEADALLSVFAAVEAAAIAPVILGVGLGGIGVGAAIIGIYCSDAILDALFKGVLPPREA